MVFLRNSINWKGISMLCAMLFALMAPVLAEDVENGGTIKGTITTSDNKPAPSVIVLLKGTKKGTISDENGQYTIRNVAPGNYTIEVSLIGYETVSQPVTVEKEKTVTVNLQLDVSEQKLNEVVITAARNKYQQPNSQYIARLPIADIENPQVYNTISSGVMRDQVVTNFDDALKNAPGIDKLWSSTGRGGDGAGYFALRGFAVQPTMKNGLAGITNGGLDVAGIERIEVIKGPSGTLFGSSLVSYGGLINVVTKRPYDHFGGSVSYTGGSYGLNRFTLDVNTPLDKDGKILFRVVGAYHDENSFQDAGFAKNRYIAPSLTYKVNDRLSFLVNAEFYQTERTNPTMIFFDRSTTLFAKNLDELGYNPKNSFTSNDLSIKNPTSNVQAQMLYQLSDSWTSQTVVSRSTAKTQGYYSYLYEGTQYLPGFPDVKSTFARYISNQDAYTNTTDIQQNFTGDFYLGKFRNRVVVGLDYFESDANGSNSNYVQNGEVRMDGFDNGVLTKAHMDELLKNDSLNISNANQKIYSAYISDVFNILPSLSAMASVRVDRFENGGTTVSESSKYGQTAVSPKFGIVYQPIINTLSVFANYMNGFTNAAPRMNKDNVMQSFDPEQANQLEGGIKVNLLGGLLSGSLSYYDIKVKNIILSTGPQEYTQGGTRYSKGIEAAVTASPAPGLNILAGYSYNDSKITKAEGTSDYLDRRPEEAGPQNLANLWATYKLTSGKLKGFGIGFGGNYASENKILNRVTTGVFTLPSYTVINASLFYNSPKFDVTFKLDNITNEVYYKGWSTLEPQMPRRFVGNVAFKF